MDFGFASICPSPCGTPLAVLWFCKFGGNTFFTTLWKAIICKHNSWVGSVICSPCVHAFYVCVLITMWVSTQVFVTVPVLFSRTPVYSTHQLQTSYLYARCLYMFISFVRLACVVDLYFSLFECCWSVSFATCNSLFSMFRYM